MEGVSNFEVDIKKNSSKDWTGNSKTAFATIGARNYAREERQIHDYYATEPKATELICQYEKFSNKVWECACGEGHMSKVLEKNGYDVYSTDLHYRGYGIGGVDFLHTQHMSDIDIVTNPPYKCANDFVRKALEIVKNGRKVAMFVKLTFLESRARKELFLKYPPKTIYISSSRLKCYKNGDENYAKDSNAIAYIWIVWEKGYEGEPTVKWIN